MARTPSHFSTADMRISSPPHGDASAVTVGSSLDCERGLLQAASPGNVGRHDESGKLTGYAQITRDITERQVTARALRESEYRQCLLIESPTDYAIFTL